MRDLSGVHTSVCVLPFRYDGELTEQDLGDIAESKRRLAAPGRSIPLSEVRKRLGL